MAPGGAKRSREVHDFLARETRGEVTIGRLTGTENNIRATKRQQPNRGGRIKRGKQSVALVTAAKECKNEIGDRIARYATDWVCLC